MNDLYIYKQVSSGLTFADDQVVIGKIVPLPLVIFLIGSSLGILLAIFTKRKEEPKLHWVHRLHVLFFFAGDLATKLTGEKIFFVVVCIRYFHF